MFDAVASITGLNVPLAYGVNALSSASPDAAAAGAAYTVLLYVFPGQANVFDAQYAADVSALPGGNSTTAAEAGLQAGLAVAAALIADRNVSVGR
jgi:hypothetical protein